MMVAGKTVGHDLTDCLAYDAAQGLFDHFVIAQCFVFVFHTYQMQDWDEEIKEKAADQGILLTNAVYESHIIRTESQPLSTSPPKHAVEKSRDEPLIRLWIQPPECFPGLCRAYRSDASIAPASAAPAR